MQYKLLNLYKIFTFLKNRFQHPFVISIQVFFQNITDNSPGRKCCCHPIYGCHPFFFVRCCFNDFNSLFQIFNKSLADPFPGMPQGNGNMDAGGFVKAVKAPAFECHFIQHSVNIKYICSTIFLYINTDWLIICN